MHRYIKIRGAREHNLKNIDLDLPRDKFIAVTGVSGSGKSSLAFDTIYAEGQRRYVESLSAYARQFLGQKNKPQIDSISGIPPAVAIQQKGAGYNPRSTVGTLTEIYDYFRLLFARVGKVHCPQCSRLIQSQSIDKIVETITKSGMEKEISIIAPLIRGRKGNYRQLFERLRSEGFVTAVVDGAVYSLDEEIELDGRKKHEIGVLVDCLEVSGSQSNVERITDSAEIALKKSGGTLRIEGISREPEIYSTHYGCPQCEISIGKIEPRNFSFNSPYGACPVCSGLGIKLEIDSSLVVLDENLSINDGAIEPWSSPITTRTGRWKNSARRYRFQMIEKISGELNFSMDKPFKDLPHRIKEILLYGSEEKFEFKLKRGRTAHTKVAQFEGAVSQLKRRYLQTDSEYVREKIQSTYMREMECPECGGKRLKKESLSVFVGGKNIAEIMEMPVKESKSFMQNLKLSEYNLKIGAKIVKEIISRLSFLIDVGVDYVSLDRKASTLSSGEGERIRLATQIGSSLVGVVYILDEPTIGLHARDTQRLLNSLKELQDIGNTVIVVEHDSQTLDVADYITDLGPRAGVHGGNIVFSGSRKDFLKCEDSLTADYYKFKKKVGRPEKPRSPKGKEIKLYGCAQYNLKNIDVSFQVGLFNCVTGVSGSGKSTLVEEILYKAVKNSTRGTKPIKTGNFREIEGTEHIQRVINIDQTPIGRTPRSNPATYTKVLTPIRDIFAGLPESRARGYSKGRFSFNVKEGTCSKCSGQGEIKLEMHFLPDVYVKCDACEGKKFTDSTLDIKYKGKNIYEVLELTVEEALEFFSKIPKIKRILKTLNEVGLGYIKLGQSSITLSGGEAQRIKLARELAKKSSGETLYILDEPTTGLHPYDIEYLLKVLHRLVDRGNTVVIIEHNLDVIKNADWVIDLGPEGGKNGGQVLVCQTPAKLLKYTKSYTGQFLKKYLKKQKESL